MDFSYHHVRARSRERQRDRDRTPPPLPRRTHHRLTLSRSSSSSSSNGADDYPYPSSHRPFYRRRAYTHTHTPRPSSTRHSTSRLERWGIWTAPSPSRCEEGEERGGEEGRHDSYAEEGGASHHLRREGGRRVSFADVIFRDGDGDGDDDVYVNSEEETFRRLSASLSHRRGRGRGRGRSTLHCARAPSPPSRHCFTSTATASFPRRRRICDEDERDGDDRATPRIWSAASFRLRGEGCVNGGFDAERRRRERERERDRWSEDDAGECWRGGERVVRWRRVERCRTDEWRPLDGWRRRC